jgi:hypothetical protein
MAPTNKDTSKGVVKKTQAPAPLPGAAARADKFALKTTELEAASKAARQAQQDTSAANRAAVTAYGFAELKLNKHRKMGAFEGKIADFDFSALVKNASKTVFPSRDEAFVRTAVDEYRKFIILKVVHDVSFSLCLSS